jgi:ABC-type antimicrobial peptide transport system permease subunit
MLQPSMIDPSSGLFWMHIVARRNPGVSVARAQAWVNTQWRQFMIDREGSKISDARRKEIAANFVTLLPGGAGISHLRSKYEAPLAILMGVVVLVLLIACANLANFLLAKSAAREREMTTRLALGSSRARIVCQILTETLLLSFIGGALGLLLSYWGTGVLIQFISGQAERSSLSAQPDMRVLAFTTAVCLLTGLLFGVAPALRVSRLDVSGTLNANPRTAAGAGGRGARLLPNMLVTAQVVFSLVLLGLVKTNPKFAGYKPEQLNALYDRILTRVDALPGVRSATISGGLPIAHGNWGSPITIQGRINAPNEDVSTLLNRVTAGYFETVGIPLLRGRTIGPEDTATSTKAVVVNQALADQYFPHGDAIGHTFTVADPSVIGTWQIVGIVRNSAYRSPGEKAQNMAYLAVTQLTGDDNYAYWLQVRAQDDPAKIAGEVRAALAGIDPNLPILEVRTISQEFDQLIDQERLVSQLSTFFSLLALALACIGLCGVMTYNVISRTGEIGIRIALGASSGGVLWMILRESLLLLAVGLAIGIPATLAASHAIQSALYGLKATDPATMLSAMAILAAVTLASALLPARRATRIDPMIALRCE